MIIRFIHFFKQSLTEIFDNLNFSSISTHPSTIVWRKNCSNPYTDTSYQSILIGEKEMYENHIIYTVLLRQLFH